MACWCLGLSWLEPYRNLSAFHYFSVHRCSPLCHNEGNSLQVSLGQELPLSFPNKIWQQPHFPKIWVKNVYIYSNLNPFIIPFLVWHCFSLIITDDTKIFFNHSYYMSHLLESSSHWPAYTSWPPDWPSFWGSPFQPVSDCHCLSLDVSTWPLLHPWGPLL